MTSTSASMYSGRLFSEINKEEVSWLWRGVLPLKKITWLVGPQGVGKSTLAAKIASMVSNDELMPDGTLCEAPGGVVAVCLEEDISETVIPRALAMGADMARMVDLHEIQREITLPSEPSTTPFTIPGGLPNLREAIKRVNATLVIVDPYMLACESAKDTWANDAGNKVFMALQEVAGDMGVAMLVLNHFKRGKFDIDDPLANMAGPKDLGHRARSALMLSKDLSDNSRCILTLIKHSLSPGMPQITLRHDGHEVEFLTGVTEAQEKLNAARQLSKSRQCILDILDGEPLKEFTPSELCQLCNTSYDTIKQTLKRMTNDSQITRTQRGFYKSLSPVPSWP